MVRKSDVGEGKMSTIIGNNIKKLRKASGHTQKELAEKLGYTLKSISAYETGINEPDMDTLSKIADIYGITVDDLLTDMGEMGLSIKDISITEDHVNNAIDIMYPVVSSLEALENDIFKKAYNKQVSIYNKLKNGKMVKSEDLMKSYDLYIDVWEKFELFEAVANMLSIMFVLCSQITEFDTMEFQNKYTLYHKIEHNEAKKIFDRDVKSMQLLKEEKDSFAKLFCEDKIECLRILRRKTKWSRLAEYYIALSYVISFIQNDNSIVQNRKIGQSLMDEYAVLGNKYCKMFLRFAYSMYK